MVTLPPPHPQKWFFSTKKLILSTLALQSWNIDRKIGSGHGQDTTNANCKKGRQTEFRMKKKQEYKFYLSRRAKIDFIDFIAWARCYIIVLIQRHSAYCAVILQWEIWMVNKINKTNIQAIAALYTFIAALYLKMLS
jgi:hypothetical protein